MNEEGLKITEEDINLLKEMKNNCLKTSVYEDEKRLLKANAITKFLAEHQENQQLKEQIKQYTDTDDLTLMYMYCNEKAKDKIKELKKQLKITQDGFMASVEESCELAKENQKYKEVIDKAIMYVNSTRYSDINGLQKYSIKGFWFIKELEDILNEV